MAAVKLVAVNAVAPDEHATRAQNAERVTQHSCLKQSRTDVVKHGERGHRIERAGGERKRRGIAVDDSTLCASNRVLSALTLCSSRSTTTSRLTHVRSQSVAAPGPAPSSNTSSPSARPAVTAGRTAACRCSSHSRLEHRRWCSVFMSRTLSPPRWFHKRVWFQSISRNGHRDRDRLDAMSALRAVTFPMAPRSRFERHVHDDHQLAWAANGVLTVVADAGTWVLPPSRAL